MQVLMIILICLSTFGAVVLLCIVAFRMREMKSESREIQQRLKFWLSERSRGGVLEIDKGGSPEEDFTKRILLPIGEQVGKWMSERVPYAKQSAIRKLLIAAGYRDKKALQFFYALKCSLACCFGLGAWVLFAVIGGEILAAFLYAGVFGAVAFIFPNFVLEGKANERRQNIDKILPDALDLLVICTEAGMGIDLSLLRVAANLGSKGKDLSEEIIFTNREMNLGQDRFHCWENLGERTGSEELKNLSRVIGQSEKVGASVSSVLRSQSEFLRVRRRQKAEEMAAKVAVKMMIPMALFIFPCIMTVIIAPVAIQLVSTFSGGLVK